MNYGELFDYNEATGDLIWKRRIGHTRAVKIFNSKFAGKVAGTRGLRKDGKPRGILVCIRWNDERVYDYAHRIISTMFDGPIPDGVQIDHADTNPFNNRRSNHRRATFSQNRHNARKRHDCSSGMKGVYYDQARGLWQADIIANGVRHRLGRFQTKGLAAVARAKAAIRYHGEFARFA